MILTLALHAAGGASSCTAFELLEWSQSVVLRSLLEYLDYSLLVVTVADIRPDELDALISVLQRLWLIF